ncbi:protein quick-to-court isoform X2 [Phymastichus coffea]|uniref:protein quick-to-court isoform X2 n=1 Tax=Phymastichus coffea TaxID=108790 RepID=UPI00273B9376|nr:protein quick-to-court isoform X2 [Phymastichus coffea]
MTMADSTESASRIPVTLGRSPSLRQKGERLQLKTELRQQQQQPSRRRPEPFPAISEHADAGRAEPKTALRRCSSSLSLQQTPPRRADDSSDVDSVRSYGSNCSNMSTASTSACEHAHFGLNGTTWSARSRRYVVHCSPQARDEPAEQYLTPTQRSARQLRQLQTLLRETRQQLDEREQQVARLTRELVELRLLQAAGGGCEAAPGSPPPDGPDGPASVPDSGHFEDGAASHFERRIDEMQRRHREELRRLEQAHYERVDALLDQLAEADARRGEARPAPGRARSESTELPRKSSVGRDGRGAPEPAAGRRDQAPEERAAGFPAVATVTELLQQLTDTRAELDGVKQQQFQGSCCIPQPPTVACRSQSLLSLQEAVSLWVLGTRQAMYRRILESRNKQNAHDPEITLQFLKSAVYYFLTDKENLHGHLNAIESILGFTDSEKLNIDRIYRSAKK